MSLRSFIRRSKFLLLLSVDALVQIFSLKSRISDSVLLVRLDAIGDFVLWLGAAQALVDRYKRQGKSVTLVANRSWAQWASEMGIFDRVVSVDCPRFQRDLFYRYRVGRIIQSLGCAVAIQPTYSRNWILGDSIVRVSGSPERIGSTGDSAHIKPWQLRHANSWYTRLIPANSAPLTEIERNAEFVRNLGETGFRTALPRLEPAALAADNPFVVHTAGEPYYVLFPGAGWKGREWPAANFREIAERLYRKTGWLGVVCGGESDVQLGESICSDRKMPALNWAGRTSLSELAAILAGARLVVTNETSAAHIAALFGVPTLCLLGGGHYGRFMPYRVEHQAGPLPQVITHPMPCFGCNWSCIYERAEDAPAPCIENIDTQTVWQQTCQLLGLHD